MDNEKFFKIYKDIFSIKYLEKLNLIETQELLSKSKLFIDFGNHPGRDRIPREAILQKTNVLIQNRGSAKYQTDVPLSKKHKFENFSETIGLKTIRKLIIEKNFKHYDYLKDIKYDNQKMKSQTKKIFKKISEYY